MRENAFFRRNGSIWQVPRRSQTKKTETAERATGQAVTVFSSGAPRMTVIAETG